MKCSFKVVGEKRKKLLKLCNLLKKSETTPFKVFHFVDVIRIKEVFLQELASILAEYGPLLSRVASSYEANAAIRQELVQDICVSVWQGLNRFKGNSSLKTYILRIAHNRCVDHVAYQSRQLKPSDELDEVTSSHSPQKEVEQHQQIEQVLQAIRELPIPQRQIVTLSMEGMSYQEIGDICGMNKNHVGVMLNRAKQSLSIKMNGGE